MTIRPNADALVGILVAGIVFTSACRGADLTVTCENIRSTRGTIRLELDTGDAPWDNKSPPNYTADVKPVGSSVTYTFKDLPPGTYALGVFHDENDNGKLDTNFLGVPREGFGFSNNPTFLRKPTFKESSFEITESLTQVTVRMRYL
jgi:uncharacterized protein (DUF2141 family)